MRIGRISKEIKGLWLEIKRRDSAQSKPYIQRIYYEPSDTLATVATALTDMESREFKDENGNKVKPISWECSCLQKKCGACAMVINGVPRLACDSFLRDYKKKIRIEPLSKFPVISDLKVDRSALYKNLKEAEAWLNSEAKVNQKNEETVYDASRCLQCGCCLEVCPNFRLGEDFFGAASFVPMSGILSMQSQNERLNTGKNYMEHAYSGCGKSLACHNICPAGIDIERMLIRANKIAVWKNIGRK